jgi:hypothetical protein
MNQSLKLVPEIKKNSLKGDACHLLLEFKYKL